MSVSKLINETDRVIHSFECVAVRIYVSVCRPAFPDDCSAGFDPVTKNSHRRVSGLSGKGTRNFFSELAFITIEHPLSFYFVYLRRPNLLSSIATVLLGQTFFSDIVQHDLSSEFGPISNGCGTEQMLLLDNVRRIAINDVVREE